MCISYLVVVFATFNLLPCIVRGNLRDSHHVMEQLLSSPEFELALNVVFVAQPAVRPCIVVVIDVESAES